MEHSSPWLHGDESRLVSFAVGPRDTLGMRLPVYVDRFVGRTELLRQVGGLLSRERLVTLIGLGGVGKTRLAVEAARQLAPLFTDGTYFVSFAGADDQSDIAGMACATLNVDVADGEICKRLLCSGSISTVCC